MRSASAVMGLALSSYADRGFDDLTFNRGGLPWRFLSRRFSTFNVD